MSERDPNKTPVQFLKGVGPYIAGLLDKKGIHSVYDLFYYFPVRYLDRRKIDTLRQLQPGKDKTVLVEVLGCGSRMAGRRRIFEVAVKDATGIAVLSWFHFNEKFLRGKYPAGKKMLVFGTCTRFGQQKQFIHPDTEDWEEEEGGSPQAAAPRALVPVYALTEGLHQKTIRKIIDNALNEYLEYLEESPLSVRAEGTQLSLKESIGYIHRPPPDAALDSLTEQNSVWHQRLIYDELFYLQLGMGMKKRGFAKDKAPIIPDSPEILLKARQALPFELTCAQERVLDEILSDLIKGEPMNRLVQGDVGSGKTVVALLSALSTLKSGYQVALMAPTEILAAQHFQTAKRVLEPLNISVALLTGSMPAKEADPIRSNLESGKNAFVVGTHALIQESVTFKNLGYAIVDEQHRFGVMQRAALKQKVPTGFCPHILVMTATPIPRTLSMTLYGDLNVSIIDELPSGRKPIDTKVYYEKARVKMMATVKEQLQKGYQAYFVYPLIEESEKSDLKDAMTMAKHLAENLPGYQVGLLHGKMKTPDKDRIMAQFKAGELHVLVSTTVIEVGIDVPRATVMVIEHAERFGLSQLHQLRGRVGRGGNQSFCLLMAGYAQSEEGAHRLRVMEESNDGFVIAEEDLKIRGPGDFLGTRQSGLPEFHLVQLTRDGKLLEAARKRAFELLAVDPDLKKSEHQILKKILKERWGTRLSLAEVS